ncbi:MAG TPA: hypothetical protein VF103_07650 [Polyangiaceae bacterium]
MKTPKPFRALVTAAVLSATALGCVQIMDIEDATCDPVVAACPNETSALTPSALCEEYCDTVMDACPGDASVYSGSELCLDVCKQLPPGSEGDTFTNSVQCRLEQARTVKKQNGTDLSQCPAAGPGGEAKLDDGGPLCGSACEAFCSIYMRVCTDAEQFKVFADEKECLDDCATVPDLGGYSTAISEGNTIQCRLWHVTAAADDPYPHCNHAAGLNTCVDSE